LPIDQVTLDKGRGLSIMCMACHGPNFEGAGSPGPDLRESKLALSEDAVWAVVNSGSLMSRGMPRFDMLTKPQVHALYVAIRAGAREALGVKVVNAEPPAAASSKPAEPPGMWAKLKGMVMAMFGMAPSAPAKPATPGGPYKTDETEIGAILDDPEACAIVDKHVPGLSKRSQISLARSMTLKQLQPYSDEFSDPVLAKIDADFAQLAEQKKQ
jgi:hypothetical protein